MTDDGSYRYRTRHSGPVDVLHGAPAPRSAVHAEVPTADVPAGNQIRFGLWGASGGGKTTYLAALRVAAELGGWRMRGVTAADSDFLQEKWQELYEGQTFPAATEGPAVNYRWMLSGDVPRRRGFGRFRRASEHVEFMLEFQDVPGDAYRLGHEATRDMLKHFMNCQGLVYLFDPVRDHAATRGGHNLGFFQGVVEQLERRLGHADRLEDGRLPHHLAVCVSKFDHPAVFHRAQEHGWINLDDDSTPRVTDDQAEAFFRDFICGEVGSRSARLLRTFIDNHFVADRVSYFVMSSIGFYLKDGAFDELDFSNVVIEDGSARIRDDVRPINVIEPLVRLHDRMRGA